MPVQSHYTWVNLGSRVVELERQVAHQDDQLDFLAETSARQQKEIFHLEYLTIIAFCLGCFCGWLVNKFPN